MEKLNELGENICVSPAVIAQKSDGSIKIALDAKELNKRIVRKRMQMPNLGDLKDRISIKITQNRKEKFWASTIDLKYAFGLGKLAKNTSKHCVIAIVGGKATGHYRFKRGFYGLADMPVVFQEMLDRNLKNIIPACQDDMIIVTRGSEEDHLKEIEEILKILQDKGYKASFEKSKFFEKEVDWCGFRIDEHGIKPRVSRTEAIAKIKPPKTLREIRSFLVSIQYLMKYIPNLTPKTAPVRNLLQKNTKWQWTEFENSAFENLKQEVNRITPLKHFNAEADCILTTDASPYGLGATLWQAEEEGRRPVAFASRYLGDSEKNYAQNDLELLGVVWG